LFFEIFSKKKDFLNLYRIYKRVLSAKLTPDYFSIFYWTFSANNRNDENLMVIDDQEVIARYQNQFEKLWLDKFSLERTRKLYGIAKVNFPFLSTTSPKPENIDININSSSQDELIKILRISQSLTRKIITLRDSLSGGFKDPQDLTQLPGITNLEWEEWKKQGIIITVK